MGTGSNIGLYFSAMPPGAGDSLEIAELNARYASGEWSIEAVFDEVLRRIEAYPDPAVWIDRFERKLIDSQIQRAKSLGKGVPLYGIPFAVKDNIDVEGRFTTAGCPAFAYVADKTATIVQKLFEAGAILVGKANLDQFATGLVGTRSPYGACANVFNREFISGGSSSGSAVAVAGGLVSFALGTDTTGSGRVPAAFNNIVGYKPTRGLISGLGVVPACRSLDCVSIFTLTSGDAATVAGVARGFEPLDPYSRRIGDVHLPTVRIRFGVPRWEQLQFFGNGEYESLYRAALDRFKQLGHEAVEIDFEPIANSALLLYQGPWVPERVAALQGFLEKHPNALLPVIATIFKGAGEYSAANAFADGHRLAGLVRQSAAEWEKMDLLFLPTTPTIYTKAQIEADPIALNRNLGLYTNFVNLMDLCAVAVPGGFTPGGLPMGVSLIAPAESDLSLLAIADQLHRASRLPLGASEHQIGQAKDFPTTIARGVPLAVAGSHLGGNGWSRHLTRLNGRLIRACKTAPNYRLDGTANAYPPEVGLVRVENGKGISVDVEVWELAPQSFGVFVAQLPPSIAVGTVLLEDNTSVKGLIRAPLGLE